MNGIAHLVLEDGSVFVGRSFGAEGARTGEVVFHTAMTGYQEMLTDPSYAAQILVLTAAEIGAVGVNVDDEESARIHPTALVVNDHVPASNYRSQKELSQWLAEHGVLGIAGIDTRKLVRHLRSRGVLRGIVTTELAADASADAIAALVERARTETSMEGRDLASEVSTKTAYAFTPSRRAVLDGDPEPARPVASKHVVAFDFGLKRSMLEFMAEEGARITVVPADTSAAQIRELGADAVFLTNGPGDPAAVESAVQTTRELLGELPIFGICLGHQILALAAGATTYKMKFGNRGANQPVLELDSGRLLTTAQNHGFAVDESSLPANVRVTHRNLNDGTVEGIEVVGARAKSVQFHPESSPGPEEARRLFGEFFALTAN